MSDHWNALARLLGAPGAASKSSPPPIEEVPEEPAPAPVEAASPSNSSESGANSFVDEVPCSGSDALGDDCAEGASSDPLNSGTEVAPPTFDAREKNWKSLAELLNLPDEPAAAENSAWLAEPVAETRKPARPESKTGADKGRGRPAPKKKPTSFADGLGVESSLPEQDDEGDLLNPLSAGPSESKITGFSGPDAADEEASLPGWETAEFGAPIREKRDREAPPPRRSNQRRPSAFVEDDDQPAPAPRFSERNVAPERNIERADSRPRPNPPRGTPARDIDPRDIDPRDREMESRNRNRDNRDRDVRDIDPRDVPPRDASPRDFDLRDRDPRNARPASADGDVEGDDEDRTRRRRRRRRRRPGGPAGAPTDRPVESPVHSLEDDGDHDLHDLELHDLDVHDDHDHDVHDHDVHDHEPDDLWAEVVDDDTPSPRTASPREVTPQARGNTPPRVTFDDDHEDAEEVVALRRGRRRRRLRNEPADAEPVVGERPAERAPDRPPGRSSGRFNERRPDRNAGPNQGRRPPRPRDEEVDQDLEPQLDMDIEEGSDELEPIAQHRNIPTWLDAVDILINANIESRRREPPRRGRGGPQGGPQGGRRR